jgi:hypothetical protein
MTDSALHARRAPLRDSLHLRGNTVGVLVPLAIEVKQGEQLLRSLIRLDRCEEFQDGLVWQAALFVDERIEIIPA